MNNKPVAGWTIYSHSCFIQRGWRDLKWTIQRFQDKFSFYCWWHWRFLIVFVRKIEPKKTTTSFGSRCPSNVIPCLKCFKMKNVFVQIFSLFIVIYWPVNSVLSCYIFIRKYFLLHIIFRSVCILLYIKSNLSFKNQSKVVSTS